MHLLPEVITLVAFGLLAVSGSQFAAVSWQAARSQVRAHGVRLRRQAELRRHAQHARLASELSWQALLDPHHAWRVVEVVETVDESVDCRSFYLRDPLGAALPEFRPGQFIMVRPALGGASQPTRCYSLSDSPGQPWWRITVKRHQSVHPRNATGTHSLSQWLHERIGVGDCLLASSPRGQFVLDEHSNGPIVLLAAGVGITPLVSMLKHSLQTAPQRPVHLFFQVQDEDHWPLGEVLHQWQQACPALSMTSYFSRQLPLDTPSGGRVFAGKFDAAAVHTSVEKDAEASYYLCGPEQWMQQLVEDLASLGVARSAIHFESFGNGTTSAASTDDQNDVTGSSSVRPWSLRFARSELRLENAAQVATIWEAASGAGLQLPAACHSGACGACRQRLLSGQVEYRTRPQCSVAAGEVLTCIAQPIGDVVIDA